jgi:toxin FitB
MIVLDTNVVSEMMLREPQRGVLAWLDRLAPESIWTTSITVYEVRTGIERMAKGRRRQELENAFAVAMDRVLQDRVLPFDTAAANEAAILTAGRERLGVPKDQRDTWIAGIVVSRRAELATRNVRHFRDLNVRVIDPWAV